jgi:diguanylate cyclase (GGDEF)-like protein
MMLNRPIQKFSSHPLATGFKLVSLIAGTELLVMLAFSFLEIDQWMSPRMTSITNALVSGISGAFMIFYWVVRPIKTGAEFSCVEKNLCESEMQYKHLFKSSKEFRDITNRKKSEDELIERTRLAKLSAEIGAGLAQNKDLRSLLQLCAESIANLLDAAFARIWILNEKENVLELMASAGMYTHLDGEHGLIPVGKFKIGIIAKDRKPQLINTVIGDPQINDQAWAKREGMIAFAGQPLVVSNRLVGVMAMFSKKPLQDATLKALASISDDIALGIKRKTAEEQIHFLAYYDNLTNLPNRNYFKEFLKKTIKYAIRHKNTFAVIIIDLDDFTRINDTFGHNLGNELLKCVSSRVLKTLRGSDHVARLSKASIARMGGDEFIVLLRDIVDVERISHVVQRLTKELSCPYELDGRDVFVTASMGISVYPEDGEDVDDLIKYADTALYHAKGRGKNNCQFYSKSMNEAALESLSVETNLRRALEQNELLLYYQPKMDSLSGQIIGMEALIRWKQSDGNLIKPEKFIPFAEMNGLIVPIGVFVLRTACLQNKQWQESGLNKISVAVSLSGLQFGQKDFVKAIFTTLKDADLGARYLELEISETTIMKNPESAVRILTELKAAGIQISIKDFGTGYSSLNYLRRLPIDTLKIDISFIRNMVTDPNDAVNVKTIIAMAHNLNLKVNADGVENEQQAAFLREHGCDTIQGYFLSPPVPAEEFPKFMRD